MNKRKNFTGGLIAAILGVVLLGVDRVIVSADSASNFTQSISVVTVIALFILLIAAIWLFWVSFQ